MGMGRGARALDSLVRRQCSSRSGIERADSCGDDTPARLSMSGRRDEHSSASLIAHPAESTVSAGEGGVSLQVGGGRRLELEPPRGDGPGEAYGGGSSVSLEPTRRSRPWLAALAMLSRRPQGLAAPLPSCYSASSGPLPLSRVCNHKIRTMLQHDHTWIQTLLIQYETLHDFFVLFK